MSLYNRRFVLFSTAAALAGCGFTPVYGPEGQASVLRNAIVVDEPKDRPSYLLTQELEQRLGRGAPGRFGLSYSIGLSQGPIVIDEDDVTARFNIVGNITYALRSLESGAVLSSGKVNNFTSYSASGTTIASQAARRDAERRLMVILADQVIVQLIAASPELQA